MVDQQEMSDNEKMAHLQHAVGDVARATIGGMVSDGRSYQEALQALQERYGRDIEIVRSSLNAVFKCPPPKLYEAEEVGRHVRHHGGDHRTRRD